MVIREADGELEVSGTPADLNVVADKIKHLEHGERLLIAADRSADPHPYARCMASLELNISSGPVRVTTEETRVTVTGSQTAIRTFASYFRFEELAPSGTHHHFEWFEGNEYIEKGSAPLVLSIA
jgi:hypothetical protein